MPTSFFQYEMLPTTWFYLSTLIILAVFFKFNRFWSVRNIDLAGLILLTPGMLLLAMQDDQWGYIWLFIVGLLLAVRLILDTIMVRRPLLEPNLTPGGLTFSCFFLVSFIVAAVTVNRGDQLDTIRTVRLEQILTTRQLDKKIGMNPITLDFPEQELANLPPGFLPFHAFVDRTNMILLPPPGIRQQILQSSTDSPFAIPSKDNNREPKQIAENGSKHVLDYPIATNSIMGASTGIHSGLPSVPTPTLFSEQSANESMEADERLESDSSRLVSIPLPGLSVMFLVMNSIIAAHIMIVLAFIYIGHCHFGNIRTGIACATLYLLHPYTNQMVGRLDHLIPAALILWAVASYRRPFFSGLWIGTAASLVFYPIFLVPLWCSFYWRRGWIRFLIGLASAILVFITLLFFSPISYGSYGNQLIHMIGKSSLWIFTQPDGFWNSGDIMYRVPVLAGFMVLCFGMILWPAHKHLATLLSCSALLMLSVQFWQLHEGGLFMAWYMPLLILTIFRPNLEDRVAQTTVVA